MDLMPLIITLLMIVFAAAIQIGLLVIVVLIIKRVWKGKPDKNGTEKTVNLNENGVEKPTRSKFKIALMIYAGLWMVVLIFLCVGPFIENLGFVMPRILFVIFKVIPLIVLVATTPIIIIWAIIKGIKALF